MYVCTYVRTYVCMYICMYVCMYVCIPLPPLSDPTVHGTSQTLTSSEQAHQTSALTPPLVWSSPACVGRVGSHEGWSGGGVMLRLVRGWGHVKAGQGVGSC